jgi:hypothetical protein
VATQLVASRVLSSIELVSYVMKNIFESTKEFPRIVGVPFARRPLDPPFYYRSLSAGA